MNCWIFLNREFSFIAVFKFSFSAEVLVLVVAILLIQFINDTLNFIIAVLGFSIYDFVAGFPLPTKKAFLGIIGSAHKETQGAVVQWGIRGD